MSGMSLASRQQLVEELQELIAELERLKAALTRVGKRADVETIEGALKGVHRGIERMETTLYH